eukprot:TRINITY_DN15127_c0_g2_i4.p1 TRINITY_DN15127_c0_g2~~TRINITY_DN15127_c0_g2_i4.p1  ORF type:complete len:181 (+),score=36.50 TRINITY_DN15127_c0_g2_i4:113-655(+)
MRSVIQGRVLPRQPIEERILQAIGRLAALSGKDLAGADLVRLEAAISALEQPQQTRPRRKVHFDDSEEDSTATDDAGSDISWASEDIKPNLPAVDNNSDPNSLTPTFGGSNVQRSEPPPYEGGVGKAWETEVVEVDVTVPEGVGEGGLLAVEYEGVRYEVQVPPGIGSGNSFRVQLQIAP